jgi:hypothetical protein
MPELQTRNHGEDAYQPATGLEYLFGFSLFERYTDPPTSVLLECPHYRAELVRIPIVRFHYHLYWVRTLIRADRSSC